jgi:hypothetical protein
MANQAITLLFLPSVSGAQRSHKPVRVVGFMLPIYQQMPPSLPLLAVKQMALISRNGGGQPCDIWDSLCCPKQLERPTLILQS